MPSGLDDVSLELIVYTSFQCFYRYYAINCLKETQLMVP